MSNRVAALSGVTGLVDFGGLSSERLSQALGMEVRQLGALVDLVRLLAGDGRARGEAIELRTTLPLIVALHALHADLRDIPCTVRHDREAPPVHLVRSALVHGVLFLVDAAKRDAAPTRGSVSLSYGGDAAWVTVAVESQRAPESLDSTGDHALLRGRIGPVIEQLDAALALHVGPPEDGESSGVRLALRMPSLAEVRRRENAAASAGSTESRR